MGRIRRIRLDFHDFGLIVTLGIIIGLAGAVLVGQYVRNDLG
mgnify:CR=1 FL=1